VLSGGRIVGPSPIAQQGVRGFYANEPADTKTFSLPYLVLTQHFPQAVDLPPGRECKSDVWRHSRLVSLELWPTRCERGAVCLCDTCQGRGGVRLHCARLSWGPYFRWLWCSHDDNNKIDVTACQRIRDIYSKIVGIVIHQSLPPKVSSTHSLGPKI
jgi:hypothetical protein